MSALEMTVAGQDKLALLSRNLRKTASAKMGNTMLSDAANIVEAKMKESVTTGETRAIDTGLLRSSMRVRSLTKKSAFIGPYATNNAGQDYSGFVHNETKFMKARPFLEVTVRLASKKLDEMFDKSLNKVSIKITKGL